MRKGHALIAVVGVMLAGGDALARSRAPVLCRWLRKAGK